MFRIMMLACGMLARGARARPYGASLTVAAASTLSSRFAISRNAARGVVGFKTTAAICPSNAA
jgi:hypothetical protein